MIAKFEMGEKQRIAAREMMDPECNIESLARNLGVCSRTLYRWTKYPDFIAYQYSIRDEVAQALAEGSGMREPQGSAVLAAQKAAMAKAIKDQAEAQAVEAVGRAALPPITDLWIIQGLAQLAMLPPKETKGSITGQIEAYKSIWTMLGMKPKPEISEQVNAEPDVYQAEWMKQRPQ